ncbi:MAG TPA: YeeE/YedE thiosulfate transporter family protein, partial [Candidatus Sabulitectum sp.]|nr:YeeE/YedE thiosulfate transporter family protein [Candidatus Sabulitectum sp.]
SFAGGLLLGLGSRWAGGCTSGHGISGTLQLTLSSWLAVVVFFASGIFFAWLLYGGGPC